MQPWGFVFLAYGIVWATIVLYVIALKRRYQKAEAELAQLCPAEEIHGRAKT
jgi:CcmD family protein